MTTQTRAAPSPADVTLANEGDIPDTDTDTEAQHGGAEAQDHDELFEAWSHWCATRRFYAPQPVTTSLLGKLSSKSRPIRGDGPDAPNSTSLSSLHLAILGQPPESLDTQIFWAHYGARAVSIKTVAEKLGISRQHYYRLLKGFCQRVVAVAKYIESNNAQARDGLGSNAN